MPPRVHVAGADMLDCFSGWLSSRPLKLHAIYTPVSPDR